MKAIYTLLFSLIFLAGFTQVQIGMSEQYTITPANANDSIVGTNYDSTITVTCYVKNTGNVSYSGFIYVSARVDTAGAPGAITTNTILSTSNLAPNDSIQYVFTDTIKPNTYKVYGNGNTIVVWPFISGATTTNSLVTEPVYVHNLTGIEELNMKRLLIYPNPSAQKLFIKPEPGVIYDKLILYDIQMKKIRELTFTEEIDVSNLPQGTYWINVTTKNKKIYTALFTKIE